MGAGRTKASLHSFPPLPSQSYFPTNPNQNSLRLPFLFLLAFFLLAYSFVASWAPPCLAQASLCFIGLGARDRSWRRRKGESASSSLRSHVPWRQAVVPQGVSQGPWSWYPPCQHPVIFYSLFTRFLFFLDSRCSPVLLDFTGKVVE